MAYDRLGAGPGYTPTLAQFLGSPVGAPDGATEPVSVLDDAIKQTRYFVYDFLKQYFDPSGAGLLPTAFGSNNIAPGSIRGSNTGVEREIKQGTVTSYELADSAVIAAKLAVSAVETAKLADGAVTEAKLADNSITGAKFRSKTITAQQLQDGSITSGVLGTDSVTATKISAGAVTAVKMADGAAGGRKLPQATEGMILVGGNSEDGQAAGPYFYPRVISGGWNIDRTGLMTLAAGSGTAFAQIDEEAPNGTNGGGSTVLTAPAWYQRGLYVPWKITFDTANPSNSAGGGMIALYDLNGKKCVAFRQVGTYLIMIKSPGYRCGEFKTRVSFYAKGDITLTPTFYYGSNGYSYTDNGNAMGWSELTFIAEVIDLTVGGHGPVFMLEQYIAGTPTATAPTTAKSAALGVASAAGATEIERFARINVLKLR